MTVAVTSPVTGGAQTGLTSPTYSVAADQAPDTNAKQWIVTSIGGTQNGVTAHTATSPFQLAFWRPKLISMLGYKNPATGQVSGPVKKNVYKTIVLKGVTPYANAPTEMLIARVELSIPAGAETYDIANCRAALSLLIGALNQQSAGLGDSVQSGSL